MSEQQLKKLKCLHLVIVCVLYVDNLGVNLSRRQCKLPTLDRMMLGLLWSS